MKIIAIDPSGDYTETKKGHTGFAIYNGEKIELLQINATDYDSKFAYWNAIIDFVKDNRPDWVVCEDFRLQPSKTKALTHQQSQTPELIGQIALFCFNHNIKFFRQQNTIRKRYSHSIFKILLTCKILKIEPVEAPNSQHERDALGHLFWFLLHNKNYPDRLDKSTLIEL